MNTQELEKILRHELKSAFWGVCALDELPKSTKRPLALIVNTDPSSKPGSHWIAIYLYTDGRAEYYDSGGEAPKPAIVDYLDRWARRGTVYTTRRTQSLFSSLCGLYCTQYLIARHYNQRLSYFSLLARLFPHANCSENDELVVKRFFEKYGMVL